MKGLLDFLRYCGGGCEILQNFESAFLKKNIIEIIIEICSIVMSGFSDLAIVRLNTSIKPGALCYDCYIYIYLCHLMLQTHISLHSFKLTTCINIIALSFSRVCPEE